MYAISHDLVHIEVNRYREALATRQLSANACIVLVTGSAAITQIKMKQSYGAPSTLLSNEETRLSSTIRYRCSENVFRRGEYNMSRTQKVPKDPMWANVTKVAAFSSHTKGCG